MPTSVYGNCNAGEYPSVFSGAFEARYPRGRRLLFGFLILNPDLQCPAQTPRGEDVYAVAVCNKSEGTNPKSKAYKICRAMLLPEEYDPIGAALGVPGWEHFTGPMPDGSRRIVEVRVDHRERGEAALSLVTHIRRPRDGEWECIEGVYEGQPVRTVDLPRFSWLQADGSANMHLREEPQGDEGWMWTLWNGTTEDHVRQFRDGNGQLRQLSQPEFEALSTEGKIRYRIARYRAGLHPFDLFA